MTHLKGRWWLTGLIVVLMVCAVLLARHFTPGKYMADEAQTVVLKDMVPSQFGDWQVDPSITPLVVDPTALELSDRIYSETLYRTYINRDGRRVMLAVAYGRDQSESLQLHTPEFCYPAQGYSVTESQHTSIPMGFKDQPVVQLVANSRNRRPEPITYWVTMGEYVVNGGPRGRRDVRFIYGFKDMIPDGMLFRISSPGLADAEGFALQQQFLQAMFAAVPAQSRFRLAGSKVYQ